MKKTLFFIIFFCLVFVISGLGLAEVEKTRILEGIEFLSGYGKADLKQEANYHSIPLIVDFDFNLKPLLQKLYFNPPPSLIQFQLEPLLASISSPKSNIEAGLAFSLKFGLLPCALKFQPYIKVGAGPEYMSLRIREQSTQYNFIDFGAIGMHYFFCKNTAFTLEGRFRHLSNCGIKEPNHGINAYFVIAGLTYQF